MAQVFLLGVAQHEVTEAAAHGVRCRPFLARRQHDDRGQAGQALQCVEGTAVAQRMRHQHGVERWAGLFEQGLRLGDAVGHLDLPGQRPADQCAHHRVGVLRVAFDQQDRNRHGSPEGTRIQRMWPL